MNNNQLTVSSQDQFITGTLLVTTAATDGAFVASATIAPTGNQGPFKACKVMFLIGSIATSGVVTARLKRRNSAGAFSAVGSTVGVMSSSDDTPISSVIATNADTDDNKMLVWDIYNPPADFVLEFQRTAGNSQVLGAVVTWYNPASTPVDDHASVEASVFLRDPVGSAT
jgi:hypothetical protein